MQKETKKDWNPNESYEKICKELNNWPNWKKKAYNEMFAISKNAKKLELS